MRGLNQKNSVDAFTYQTSAFDYRDGPAEKLQYLQVNIVTTSRQRWGKSHRTNAKISEKQFSFINYQIHLTIFLAM